LIVFEVVEVVAAHFHTEENCFSGEHVAVHWEAFVDYIFRLLDSLVGVEVVKEDHCLFLKDQQLNMIVYCL
jgi:hypothetical protein